MAHQGCGQAWGKLVKVSASPGSEILLINRECTVGRKKDCDLSFPANKLVSGNHCRITQDQNSGQVWLEDMSTNGTVINMSKVVKKQTHLLQNGDVIHFVYRKNEPEQNIAYVYQAIGPQESASQDTEELTGSFDISEPGSPLPEPAAASASPAGPSASAAVPTVPPRRRAQRRPGEQPSEVKRQLLEALRTRPEAPAPPPRSEDELFLLSLVPSLQSLPPQTKEFSFLFGISIDIGREEDSDLTETESEPVPVEPVIVKPLPQAGHEDPQPSTSRSSFHIYNVPLSSCSDDQRGCGSSHSDSAVSAAAPQVSLRGAAGKDKTEGATTDKMEESLACIVCQDLLHDCVSLQPCMHTFCAACYSGWMERSSLCPTCRCPVERIRKNHILNNLVEAYLLQHPEKCRSEEELRSMDARNKITQDMLQPKVERSFSDEEGSSDYLFELSDNDSDISDMSQPYMMCRQCPGYHELSSVLSICEPAQPEGPAKVPGDGASTSSDTSTGYSCSHFRGVKST
ncbi:hypothetical protein cypCar_00009784 [Cyprinus carpio]|nr:hypothetical protein cypCar_00009784 [Cyprinus carpio]